MKDDPFEKGLAEGERLAVEAAENRTVLDNLASQARKDTQALILTLHPKFQGKFVFINQFEGDVRIATDNLEDAPFLTIRPAGEHRASGYELIGGGHNIYCQMPDRIVINEICASSERVLEVAGMFFGSWNGRAKNDGKPAQLWQKVDLSDGTWVQKGYFWVKKDGSHS